jgi:hypothetical protein
MWLVCSVEAASQFLPLNQLFLPMLVLFLIAWCFCFAALIASLISTLILIQSRRFLASEPTIRLLHRITAVGGPFTMWVFAGLLIASWQH